MKEITFEDLLKINPRIDDGTTIVAYIPVDKTPEFNWAFFTDGWCDWEGVNFSEAIASLHLENASGKSMPEATHTKAGGNSLRIVDFWGRDDYIENICFDRVIESNVALPLTDRSIILRVNTPCWILTEDRGYRYFMFPNRESAKMLCSLMNGRDTYSPPFVAVHFSEAVRNPTEFEDLCKTKVHIYVHIEALDTTIPWVFNVVIPSAELMFIMTNAHGSIDNFFQHIEMNWPLIGIADIKSWAITETSVVNKVVMCK